MDEYKILANGSLLLKGSFTSSPSVQSRMTDVPDNRRPRWPKFKQTEEFYNITMFFFNTSKFTFEVKNLADIYCIFKNFEVLKKYYYFINFLNLFKFGHLGRSVIWDVGSSGTAPTDTVMYLCN